MSDIDEIDGFGPSAPPLPTKKRKQTNARPAAGSSKLKPASKATSSKRKPPVESIEDDDDDDDALQIIEPQEHESEAAPPTVKNKGKEKAVTVNGRDAKGKGKAKAQADSEANGPRNETPMLIEGSDDDNGVQPQPQLAGKGKKPTAVPPPSRKADQVSLRELERVKRQLEGATAQRDKLQDQLKELFSIRQTEAENDLQELTAQYESKLKAQEELNKELTSQLTRVDPMLRGGKSSTLHFLTRQAADAEKQAIEDEVQRLTGVVQLKDDVIAQKNQELRELKRSEDDLKMQLKAEIERNRTLLANRNGRDPPGSTLRGRAGRDAISNDPKNGATISLYEDMTNFLITNVKFEKGQYLDTEDWIYYCIFTHSETETSLTFTLTSSMMPKHGELLPIRSKDQLFATIKYQPLELDKESPAFVQKLEYLSGGFSFARDQMDIFLRTLNERLGAVASPEVTPIDVDKMEE
ncbi:hypothetical protein BV25DRAFT_1899389 [Artomyces pyxidatus]|uniref:Uncharacterized protein n=1 Tax=Artomyces pyxidatus TaxID=48021 RepID=A0ACB8T5Z2_9AGAM|nr:hypothetical protein BV25DRAFT_1899389 [Artomyces pyxidatus]